jgi:hypothetical protein
VRLFCIVFLSTLALGSSNSALAGEATGPINQYIVRTSNFAFVRLTGPYSSQPTCATQLSRFAFDYTTQKGEEISASLRFAYALGLNVRAVGTGVCDIWPDTETLNYIVIGEEAI